MYSPPTKDNWSRTVPYNQKYTKFYEEGYAAAKDRVSIYDNPYGKENFGGYWWYQGYGDYVEWNSGGEAITL